MSVATTTHAHREPLLIGLACVVAATLVAAFILNPILAIGAVGGVLGIVVLVRLPLRLVPAVCLVLFALVPAQYLPTHDGTVSPTLGAAIILLMRFVVGGGRIRIDGVLALWGVASTLLVIATLASPLPLSSLAWSFNALVLVLALSLVVRELPGAAETVVRTWIGLGGALGAYALLELALRQNPLMGWLYRDDPSIQGGWSIYRATTTLGHPLINGVFFAVAAVLGLAALAASPSRRTAALTLLSMAGVVASGSRGALLALGVGVVLVLLRTALRINSGRVLTALLLLCCVVAIPAVLWVGQRSSTDEGAGSNAVRAETLRDGLVLWQQKWLLGAGPGISDTLKRQMSIGDSRRGIENSWLQLAVSLGAVGIAVAVLLVVVALVVSRRSVLPAIGAALIVYVVSVTSFNLIESVRPALVMLGLLLGVALAGINEAASAPRLVPGRAPLDEARRTRHAI